MLHGIPKLIISHLDPKFTSKFSTRVHKDIEPKLRFNVALHPQMDGQMKQTIQTLETFLRMRTKNTSTIRSITYL